MNDSTSLVDARDALLKAFFDLLEEEQAQAEKAIRVTGRRNAASAAISDMVERVFLSVGKRAIAAMDSPSLVIEAQMSDGERD